jgi:hypothetical protein
VFIAHVELAGGMELILNLGWALVAVWMVCAWLRFAPSGFNSRRKQAVTLAVIILILLPAISMTDDLVAAQNPAEVVSAVRRDHDDLQPHSIVPMALALPMPMFAGLGIAVVQMAAPSNLSTTLVDYPGLESIRNRPPPAA